MGEDEVIIIDVEEQKEKRKEKKYIENDYINSKNDIISNILDNLDKVNGNISEKKREAILKKYKDEKKLDKIKSESERRQKIYAILFIIFIIAVNIFAIVLYQYAITNFSGLFTNPTNPYFFYP